MVCCKFRLKNEHYQWIGFCTKICLTIYRFVMLILGPVMFVSANFLIVSVAGILFYFFIPEFCQNSTFLYTLNMFFGLYLMINIEFNYFACCLTPAGSPSYCADPGRVLGEKVSIVDGRKIYQFSYRLEIAPYVTYKYCQACKAIKPPRAHHCSVAGKCIYNMDHYCPWMANCVGFYNYRYFMMFLAYLQVGCWYVMILLLVNFVRLPHNDRAFIKLSSMFQTNLFVANNLSASAYCFTLALSAAISSGILLIWHIYLCLTNQTTIEFYINMGNRQDATAIGVQYKNPFDEGWRKNLKRIFGYVPWYMNLWPSFHKPADPKYPFELKPMGLRDQLNV